MLSSAVVGIVRFCTRFPWLIILAGICAAGASAVYVAGHFAISTDINKLISPNLDWRQRELKLETEFPGHFNSTLVVVNAPSPELVSAATRELTQRLAAQPKLFHSVADFSGSEFFARNAWLFQSTADVERLTTGLGRGAPVISVLAGDPSLRGLTKVLSLALVGVQMHRVTLDDLAPPLSMAADTLDDVLDGHAGRLLLAGIAERQAGDAERAAALHRGSSGIELFGARAGADLERGHPARRRRISILPRAIRRACG